MNEKQTKTGYIGRNGKPIYEGQKINFKYDVYPQLFREKLPENIPTITNESYVGIVKKIDGDYYLVNTYNFDEKNRIHLLQIKGIRRES